MARRKNIETQSVDLGYDPEYDTVYLALDEIMPYGEVIARVSPPTHIKTYMNRLNAAINRRPSPKLPRGFTLVRRTLNDHSIGFYALPKGYYDGE
jgi:hypothetical protein